MGEVIEQFRDLILATQCQIWQKVVRLVTRNAQNCSTGWEAHPRRLATCWFAPFQHAGFGFTGQMSSVSMQSSVRRQVALEWAGSLCGLVRPCYPFAVLFAPAGFSIRGSAVRALTAPRTGIKRAKKKLRKKIQIGPGLPQIWKHKNFY